MPTRHRIKVRVPIPREVSPAHVVSTLQTFEPLLDNHSYVIDYRPKPWPISEADLAVINGDPFFREDLESPSSEPATATDARWWVCDVWEDVYWVPFLVPYFSRLKRYLAIGRRTEGGIRFRQCVSGGVVTRGSFTVVERGTGRPYVSGPAEDIWDEDTEKGSIADEEERRPSGNEIAEGENINENYLGEKRTGSWDAQDDTDAESEPAWDIVCECEIEMPLILVVSRYLRRGDDRDLCEDLCKSVIHATIMEFDEYRVYSSNLVSTLNL
ncbi:hypothetical protein F5Y10DRAFT_233014 [Nemania abortiva]|nr:hypothetical protein F5Y10DRAFT_233014 [Nemania abortiva]